MLTKFRLAAALVAAAAPIAAPGAANAALIAFAGQFSNDTPTPMPDPSCLPGQMLVNITPGNSTAAGTSNLGAFGPSLSHCIALGQPYTGVFSFDFGLGDVLSGASSGFMTPTGTPNVFNSFVTYVATGGTGRFLGVSGTINGVGLLDRRPVRPLNHLALTGLLDMPAVPEPATWVLMAGGFGLVGGSLRSRPRARLLA